MTSIPIYYINLASRPDRRAFMEEQFAVLGLHAERIDAVTPKNLSAEEIESYCNPRNYSWLTPVELSCSKSHMRALEGIARSTASFGAVIEDDVVLSSKLPDFLRSLVGIKPPADIIRIETDRRFVRCDPVAETMPSPPYRLRIIREFSWGTGGYLLTPAAAKEIVSSGELLLHEADRAIFDPLQHMARTLKLRHLEPALCVQLHLQKKVTDFTTSDISSQAGERQTMERSLRPVRFLHGIRKFLYDTLIVDVNHIYHQHVRGAKKARIEFVE